MVSLPNPPRLQSELLLLRSTYQGPSVSCSHPGSPLIPILQRRHGNKSWRLAGLTAGPRLVNEGEACRPRSVGPQSLDSPDSV